MPHLKRRGFDLGHVPTGACSDMPSAEDVKAAWLSDAAIVLPSLLIENIENQAENIEKSHRLMENVLETGEITPFLEQPPYQEAIQENFFIVAASPEEHDAQGIEKIYFDAYEPNNHADNEDDVVAEELWCKGSWLSFIDDDASLRFRFSWGMEGFEDVAADPVKQHWAGELCNVLFPESAAITENEVILNLLKDILDKEPSFVERIIYFNAPNGGAQMHHDVERGHAGVVFAQMSGSTFWLALAKPKLIDELLAFVADENQQEAIQDVLPNEQDRQALFDLCSNREQLNTYMDEADHELVEAIFDRSPAFIVYLVERGYSHTLEAGDVLLLPQRDLDNCVWHSVFTLGENPGEALSFAVR